jgi:hypothetical protein
MLLNPGRTILKGVPDGGDPFSALGAGAYHAERVDKNLSETPLVTRYRSGTPLP